MWRAQKHPKHLVSSWCDEVHHLTQRSRVEAACKVELASSDAAAWIPNVVAERCGNAALCMDPFDFVKWATNALREVPRSVWNDLRCRGQKERASAPKGSRWALWKNPEDLAPQLNVSLVSIERDNRPLCRAYLLEQHVLDVSKHEGPLVVNVLDYVTA